MKKLFSLALMLAAALVMSTAASCFAMQFSQPVKVGVSFCDPYNGYGHQIEGATEIKAKKYFHPVKKAYLGYDKGYATFDGGKLYVYYDGANNFTVRIGASDRANTVQTECGAGAISKINTDQGITFYFFNGVDAYGERGQYPSYELIGKRADGRFVKYVEGVAIDKAYGISQGYDQTYYTIDVKKDSIIVHYRSLDNVNIKLQWDEAAKWFSYARL